MDEPKGIGCDRVVLSVNESWLYFDFWPLVAYAYRTIFPEMAVTLVFLTERLENDPLVAVMRTHGDVVLLRPVRHITQAAQTKMARYWYAATRGDEVCCTDDIDEIPISRDLRLDKFRRRWPGSILFVGSEVYEGDGGQAPAGITTAEGRVFRALLNPDGLPFGEWLDTFRGGASDIMSRTQHEGMECTTSMEALGTQMFSDERLLAGLRKQRPVPETYAARGYDVGRDTIDRSYMGFYDKGRLEQGAYVSAHVPRPYAEHKDVTDAVMGYIKARYAGGPLPSVIGRRPAIDPGMEFGGSGMTPEAMQWIFDNIPTDQMILEVGSGHVSTNYLSRWYFVVSVEEDLEFVNIYPAHYIYAPRTLSVQTPSGRWYDPNAIRQGLAHPRVQCRKQGLLIVDGPPGENREPILDCELFSFDSPVMIDDIWRASDRKIAEGISRKTGRPVQWFEQFAIV